MTGPAEKIFLIRSRSVGDGTFLAGAACLLADTSPPSRVTLASGLSALVAIISATLQPLHLRG